MVPCWIESLLTSCPWHLRRMGYLRELLGIGARERRCRQAWAPHLERSREVVRLAMSQCTTRRKAVILGSGLLLDVPLAELAATFQDVVLVDLIHPLRTRRVCRQLANVTLRPADVTGIVETVYRVADDPHATLPRAAPTLFHDDPTVDLVASINLLSQLPYLPADYLYREGAHAPEAIEAFARDVVLAHLAYLERFSCPVALITDLERLKLDDKGEVVECLTALRGVRPPWPGDEWIWNLAPRPSACSRYSFQRRVLGIPNVRQTGPREQGLLS